MKDADRNESPLVSIEYVNAAYELNLRSMLQVTDQFFLAKL